MAETQNGELASALRNSLSAPRFGQLIDKAGGNEFRAMELCIGNSDLAGAFMYPLQILEVTLRNAVDRTLERKFSADWHHEKNFKLFLEKAEQGSVHVAIDRITSRNPRKKFSKNDVIAELQLGFWTNIFNEVYFKKIWKKELRNSFPGLKLAQSNATVSDLRKLRKKLKGINKFRNHVAHHHFLLDKGPEKVHSEMITVISSICPNTARWTNQNSRVRDAIRSSRVLLNQANSH